MLGIIEVGYSVLLPFVVDNGHTNKEIESITSTASQTAPSLMTGVDVLTNNNPNYTAREAIHLGANATVFQANLLEFAVGRTAASHLSRNEKQKCCH